MKYNPKAVMQVAKKQVVEHGRETDQEIPISEGLLTLQKWVDSLAIFAEASKAVTDEWTPELAKQIHAHFKPMTPEMSMSPEAAMRDMDMLLGEDTAKTLRYLMKTLPAIQIHGAEVSDNAIAYQLKYRYPDGSEYYLATVMKDLMKPDGDQTTGVLFTSRQSVDISSTNMDYDSSERPTTIAKTLYVKALSIPGIASRYFGRDAEPFPEPA